MINFFNHAIPFGYGVETISLECSPSVIHAHRWTIYRSFVHWIRHLRRIPHIARWWKRLHRHEQARMPALVWLRIYSSRPRQLGCCSLASLMQPPDRIRRRKNHEQMGLESSILLRIGGTMNTGSILNKWCLGGPELISLRDPDAYRR